MTLSSELKSELNNILPPLPPKHLSGKERHRFYCRRNYLRSQNRLSELRKELAKVEQEYTNSLERALALQNILPISSEELDAIHEIKMKLKLENQRLKRLCSEYLEFQNSVSLHLSQVKKDTNALIFDIQDLKNPAYLENCNNEFPPHLVKPFTDFECWDISSQQYLTYTEFEAQEFPAGVRVFGWLDQGKIVGDNAMYHLTKAFPQRSACEDSLAFFRFCTDPVIREGLPSGPNTRRCARVQVVDANNVVMYEEVRRTVDGKRISRSAYLQTRLQTSESEYFLFYTRLDSNKFVNVEPPSPDDPWNSNPFQAQQWARFRDGELEEDQSIVTICGVARAGVGPNGPVSPEQLLVGELCGCLQAESMALFQPMFSLCNN